MLSIIDVSELDYLGEVLNSPANADLYFDMKSQTLNLGIYITDLAYAALFGRHQETLDYLETVQSMSEAVRLTGAVNDALLNRARENADYLDSLFVISNDAFKKLVAQIYNIFGGRIGVYETLFDRARREAIIRMKEQARMFGANMIVNTRFETSRLGAVNSGNKGLGIFEVLAYGTAVKVSQ